MLPHSAAYDDAIVAGANVLQRITIYRAGQPVVEQGLYGVGLVVQLDETAACVRQLSGAIADPDGLLYPHLATDPLAPYGVELLLEIGVELGPGLDPEYVPAGLFRLWTTGDGSRGPIAVRGQDRAAVIAKARNEAPYVVAGGTPLADAFTNYAQAKFPGLPVLVDPDSHNVLLPPTPTVYLPGGAASTDPWDDLRAMAADHARQAVLDPTGTLTLSPVPDPAQLEACYEYVPGARNLAVATPPIQDTTGVHNVAVVSAQGTGVDTPVTVVTEVTDPASPVYPPLFGRVPIFLTSNMLQTAQQCTDAGLALLRREQGGSVNVPLTAAPHPAHVPGDVVHYVSDEAGVDALLALSRWQLRADLRARALYTTRTVG